jgi:hypothetical protein
MRKRHMPARPRQPERSRAPVTFDMPVILTPEEVARLLKDVPKPETDEGGRR